MQGDLQHFLKVLILWTYNYVPGTVSSALNILFHLLLTNNPMRIGIIILQSEVQ